MDNTGAKPLFGFSPTTTAVGANYGAAMETMGDISKIQANVQTNKFDFLGVAKAVNEAVISPLAEEKNMADAHKALLESQKFLQDISPLSGTEKVKAIEDKIKAESGNEFSEGYRKGSLSVLESGHTQALGQQEEERVNATLNIVASNFLADSKDPNGIWKTDPVGYNAAVAKKYNLNPAHVRDAITSSMYSDFVFQVQTASNTKELEEVKKNISKAKEPFRNPMFLDSRGKEFSGIVAGLERQLQSAISLKKEEINTKNAFNWYNMMGSGDILTNHLNPTAVVEPAAREAFGYGTNSYWSALHNYDETFKKNEGERRYYYDVYKSGQSIYTAPINMISLNEHPEAKKIITKEINNTLQYLFDTDNVDNLNRVMTNVQPLLGDFGSKILNDFYSGQDSEGIYTKIDTIMSTPKGATNMLNAVGLEGLSGMMATHYVSKYVTNGDIAAAQDTIAKKTIMPTGTIETSVYKSIMNNNDLTPEARQAVLLLAKYTGSNKEAVKDIMAKLENTISKHNGVLVDKSYGDLKSGDSKDIETAKPDLFYKEIGTTLEGLGISKGSIILKNHPNGWIEVKDKNLNNTITFIDPSPYGQKVRDTLLKEHSNSIKFPALKKAGDAIYFKVVDFAEKGIPYSKDMFKSYMNDILPLDEPVVEKMYSTLLGLADGLDLKINGERISSDYPSSMPIDENTKEAMLDYYKKADKAKFTTQFVEELIKLTGNVSSSSSFNKIDNITTLASTINPKQGFGNTKEELQFIADNVDNIVTAASEITKDTPKNMQPTLTSKIIDRFTALSEKYSNLPDAERNQKILSTIYNELPSDDIKQYVINKWKESGIKVKDVKGLNH